MKAKQKTIRIFDIEITNDEDFFAYMDKNLILLKDFFLLLNGQISDEVKKYLDDHGICFKIAKECNIKISSKHNSSENRAIMPNKPKESKSSKETKIEIVKQRVKTLVIEKPIRSGTEIEHDGDITVFGRVNSAAKVIAEGNVEIYGIIDGLVQCDGDYMIVQELGKGHIIFNGDILDRDLFDKNVKKITKDKDGILVKDLFETINY